MNRLLAVCVGAMFLIGCSRSASELPQTTGAVTPVAFNLAGAPTVEFSVPDMMCPEGCGVKVKEILSQQPGAKEVVVNFDAKTATVAIEAEQFDADTAVAALVDHQFEHSAVKSSDPAASVRTSEQLPRDGHAG